MCDPYTALQFVWNDVYLRTNEKSRRKGQLSRATNFQDHKSGGSMYEIWVTSIFQELTKKKFWLKFNARLDTVMTMIYHQQIFQSFTILIIVIIKVFHIYKTIWIPTPEDLAVHQNHSELLRFLLCHCTLASPLRWGWWWWWGWGGGGWWLGLMRMRMIGGCEVKEIIIWRGWRYSEFAKELFGGQEGRIWGVHSAKRASPNSLNLCHSGARAHSLSHNPFSKEREAVSKEVKVQISQEPPPPPTWTMCLKMTCCWVLMMISWMEQARS